MFYVVVETVYSDRYYIKKFTDIRSAKLSAGALRRKNFFLKVEVLTQEQYDAEFGVMVERTNLMTGEKYMERKDTPYYCSPASKAYWSM